MGRRSMLSSLCALALAGAPLVGCTSAEQRGIAALEVILSEEIANPEEVTVARLSLDELEAWFRASYRHFEGAAAVYDELSARIRATPHPPVLYAGVQLESATAKLDWAFAYLDDGSLLTLEGQEEDGDDGGEEEEAQICYCAACGVDPQCCGTAMYTTPDCPCRDECSKDTDCPGEWCQEGGGETQVFEDLFLG